ncbi:MAG: cohesin domain-containing protein [Patescibacteria group bacterium]|jgi:hypothetical protein
MNLSIKNKIIIFLAFCFLFFSATAVFAAELSFGAAEKQIQLNDEFEVQLTLNTAGELINAVEGIINFPVAILELKEIKSGNSIINFWLEKPQAKENGKIVFSGITPGGFNGDKGLIFSLTFKTKAEGEGILKITNYKILLNDGLGTSASSTALDIKLVVSSQAPAQLKVLEKKDINAPEIFTPTVAYDPNIFNGQYFLVFASQDKGSGIDYYEIRETKEFVFFGLEFLRNKDWVKADSPYLLKDQFLKSYIYVKAVDKAGNQRIAKLHPKNSLSWYENYVNWFIIILVVLFILVLVFKKIWRIKSKKL